MSHQQLIDRLLDHYERPRHSGPLEPADLVFSGGIPDCGDVITLYLRLAAGRLSGLSFEGRGCSVSMGAASLLMERMQGAALADLLALDEALASELVGAEVLRARPRCATLAISTLKAAALRYRAELPAEERR